MRLSNSSQLAGFAKRDDLQYLLGRLCAADYLHEPRLLAPTPQMLKAYRAGELSWDDYEVQFIDLIARRKLEDELSPELFAPRTALLCSEHTAERCHRRLIVEYLGAHWPGITAVHLPRSLNSNP
ncbi:DUF488 family protein [Candidatus Poriferisodalis sp.]|uniref:DUF488 family protein, N3 subclade n=1 Tax=Candidatus Poriferisodalis sp. TaxID=3101277 RepID=UPI003B593143